MAGHRPGTLPACGTSTNDAGGYVKENERRMIARARAVGLLVIVNSYGLPEVTLERRKQPMQWDTFRMALEVIEQSDRVTRMMAKQKDRDNEMTVLAALNTIAPFVNAYRTWTTKPTEMPTHEFSRIADECIVKFDALMRKLP